MGKDTNMGKKIAIGAAVAGVVGYAAGILTAPKSGKETREDIGNKAGDIKASLEQQLAELNDELKELIAKSKTATLALSAKAKEEFNEAVLRAKDAQNKTATVLKAVKVGEAEDPELNKAIKQAQLAQKNLAKFYKN